MVWVKYWLAGDDPMPKVVPGYKEEARRTILETAESVFAEKGYQGATMDEVARRLGVSKGAVYQYFPSKDVLFQDLAGDVSKKVELKLRAAFSGTKLRAEAEGYIDAEFERLERGETLMFEALAEAQRNPTLDKVVRGNYSACHRVIGEFLEGMKAKGKLKRELDTDSVAKILMALRHGVLVSVLQGLSKEEARKVWLDGFDLALGKAVL